MFYMVFYGFAADDVPAMQASNTVSVACIRTVFVDRIRQCNNPSICN